jgi:leader peptidase (prepilin peptidase)/N-methyltransferase
MFGSFLNVVIVRLPIMIEKSCKAECEDFLAISKQELEYINKDFNLFTPRSHCPKCNHVIAVWENIPLISFIFLLGTCRYCKQPISLRYPIIEALTLIISLLIAWHFGIEIKTIYALLLVWILIVQAFIDLEHTFIPDEITMPALWLGLISNCHYTFCSSTDAIFGAVFGYLSLWIVYWLFKLIAKKEGMGHGDFKLLAMLGAWLGWQYLPLIIIISSILGTIVGVILIIKKNKHLSSAIPFGPYLAIAGIIALLYGKEINMLYWQYTGLL